MDSPSIFSTTSVKEPTSTTVDEPTPTTAESLKIVTRSVIERTNAATFKSIGVADWLVQQCTQMGIARPSAVQTNCIPRVLAGDDVLGCAKTGTGKTLAFALPILQTLAVDPYGIYALILTPTRELAFQIGDQFKAFGRPLGLKECVITGGRDTVMQASELHKRPHVVIATPGRLADHIESSGTVKNLFAKLKFFVLDEADRLLGGQYGEQLATIFSVVPKQRQTLLFSATLTDALNKVQQVSTRQPYLYEDKTSLNEDETNAKTVANLEQRYVLCVSDVKDAYLVYVVTNFLEKNPNSSVLIFAHTCRECQALTGMLRQLHVKCASLHSMIPQRERMTAMSKFRSSRVRVLLCTDVAARGLDISHVDLVINHNIPRDVSTYIHRVGRSARAGRFGAAITFVTQYDIALVHAVEEAIGRKLDELKVSEKSVASHVTEVLVAKRTAEIRLDRENFGEKREINKRKQMIMEGMDPEDVDKAIAEMKERREKGSQQRVKQTEKSEKRSMKGRKTKDGKIGKKFTGRKVEKEEVGDEMK